jgi:hypothetical protein
MDLKKAIASGAYLLRKAHNKGYTRSSRSGGSTYVRPFDDRRQSKPWEGDQFGGPVKTLHAGYDPAARRFIFRTQDGAQIRIDDDTSASRGGEQIASLLSTIRQNHKMNHIGAEWQHAELPAFKLSVPTLYQIADAAIKQSPSLADETLAKLGFGERISRETALKYIVSIAATIKNSAEYTSLERKKDAMAAAERDLANMRVAYKEIRDGGDIKAAITRARISGIEGNGLTQIVTAATRGYIDDGTSRWTVHEGQIAWYDKEKDIYRFKKSQVQFSAFYKAHVKAHTRRSQSGAVAQVKDYDTSRIKIALAADHSGGKQAWMGNTVTVATLFDKKGNVLGHCHDTPNAIASAMKHTGAASVRDGFGQPYSVSKDRLEAGGWMDVDKSGYRPLKPQAAAAPERKQVGPMDVLPKGTEVQIGNKRGTVQSHKVVNAHPSGKIVVHKVKITHKRKILPGAKNARWDAVAKPEVWEGNYSALKSLAKAHVIAHQRRSQSGSITTVRAHERESARKTIIAHHKAVVDIADAEGITQLEALTRMQTGAAKIGDERTIGLLGIVKRRIYAQNNNIEKILADHYGVGVVAAPPEAVLWAAERIPDKVHAKKELAAANEIRRKHGRMPASPHYGHFLF